MTKIIDLRLRPPYKSFTTTAFYENYNSEANIQQRLENGWSESEAATKKSMDLMIKEMDENHVVYGVAIARESNWGGAAKNSDLLGLLADYPNRFIGVPHLQYGAEKDPLKTIDEYVINGPCSAVYLEPGFRFEKHLMHANDERLYPIYEKCEHNNIPVLLQYGGGVNSVEYFTPSDIYHIAEDFPKMKLAITHGGWPQVMPMIHQAFAHPNVYLATDIYFNGYPGSHDYVFAANSILKDKIMFGSSFPGFSLKDAVNLYLSSGLKEENLEKVLYKNAAKFFNLDLDE